VEHGMTPGHYAIRADEINRANGGVLARAEVPFTYPQQPSAINEAFAKVKPAAKTTPAPLQTSAEPLTQKSQPANAPPANAVAEAPTNPAPAPAAPTATAAPTPVSPEAAPNSSPAVALIAKAPVPANASTPPKDVVVKDVRTTKVVRGDSLWRLGRRFYGNGLRYTQIYSANASQIRDPRLIYPGQIFVVPKDLVGQH
jgi:nucleoid-associated protein YgaU